MCMIRRRLNRRISPRRIHGRWKCSKRGWIRASNTIIGSTCIATRTAGRTTAAAEAVPSLLVVDMYLEWWWYPAIVLAAIALGLIIGGVIQRFGGKGGWFLWAIWMAVIFGDSLFGGFVFLKDLVPLMVVLLAGSLVWSVWSLLHAVVKN